MNVKLYLFLDYMSVISVAYKIKIISATAVQVPLLILT